MAKPLILGIGGTLRPNSSSEKALRICLGAAERAGAEIVAITGAELSLPMYSPGSETRSPTAIRLVRLMRECQGLIVSSPSYHGSLSGLIKNALDYTEDLSGDPRPYLEGRAVGCIACAGGWQGAGATLASLRSITHALRGWPTPMGAGINAATDPFDAAGNCLDESARFQLELIGRQVAEFARMRESTLVA